LEIEFDPLKSDRNLEERGIPFSLVAEFDWESAIQDRSDRHGEQRTIAVGLIGDRVHVLIYTKRSEILRVISLRRANKREVTRYEEAKSLPDRRRQSRVDG
jgi:uncharacterized protein